MKSVKNDYYSLMNWEKQLVGVILSTSSASGWLLDHWSGKTERPRFAWMNDM